MKNAMTYNGYAARIEFDAQDRIIFAALVVGNFLPRNLITINYTMICIGLLISAISIIFGIFLMKGVNDK
jgi:hypothetical protein